MSEPTSSTPDPEAAATWPPVAPDPPVVPAVPVHGEDLAAVVDGAVPDVGAVVPEYAGALEDVAPVAAAHAEGSLRADVAEVVGRAIPDVPADGAASPGGAVSPQYVGAPANVPPVAAAHAEGSLRADVAEVVAGAIPDVPADGAASPGGAVIPEYAGASVDVPPVPAARAEMPAPVIAFPVADHSGQATRAAYPNEPAGARDVPMAPPVYPAPGQPAYADQTPLVPQAAYAAPTVPLAPSPADQTIVDPAAYAGAPYAGAPYPGQASYPAQPSAGAAWAGQSPATPAYPAQTYAAQTPYQTQPGYPGGPSYPGGPGSPSGTPRKKSNVGLFVLIGVLAAALIAGGLWYFLAGRDKGGGTPAQTSSTTAAPSTTTPALSPTKTTTTTTAAPPTTTTAPSPTKTTTTTAAAPPTTTTAPSPTTTTSSSPATTTKPTNSSTVGVAFCANYSLGSFFDPDMVDMLVRYSTTVDSIDQGVGGIVQGWQGILALKPPAAATDPLNTMITLGQGWVKTADTQGLDALKTQYASEKASYATAYAAFNDASKAACPA